jgi:pimeloyl-ACP methyl ester carboxylesterase
MEIERRTIDTRDGRIVIYEAEQGPRTVVCLHGWTRAPRVWFNVLRTTPPGYRAIAPDQLLESDPPRGGYTIPALADRVAALLDALGVERAYVAGHSMGGGVALDFALRYPARVERLALICTGAHTAREGTSGGAAAIKLLRATGKTPETMRQIVRGWFHDEPPAAEMDAMLADAMRWPEQALFDLRASMEASDYRPRLGEIAVPTLVVHGEHDHGRPLDQAQALATGVQHGRLVVIAGCGHTPSQETPTEFNRHFWAFLQGE